MKRILLCVVAALVYCSLPAWVCAEGSLPGMPSFGGWSCAPAHKAHCAVAGKMGYLGYHRGLVFDMTAQGVSLSNLIQSRQEYPVEGVWVGASVWGGGDRGSFMGCDPGNPLCLAVGGSWLFPNNKEGIEQVGFGFARFYRPWRPTTQWYTIDASASRCAGANFSLVGGFRYDSFATKFSDPSVEFGSVTPADEAELVLTSYMPYVGAMTTWGPVKVGVIGLPWVPGTVEYRDTFGIAVNGLPSLLQATGNYRNSYFLETYAEFG